MKALGVARSFMEKSTSLDLAEGATVEEALKMLPTNLQEMADRKELSIMVNGADVSAREGLSTRLHGGDELALFPFAHGG